MASPSMVPAISLDLDPSASSSRSPSYSHSLPPSNRPSPSPHDSSQTPSSQAPNSHSKSRGTKRKVDSNTPTPALSVPAAPVEEPRVAKMGVRIPGSGDRGENGEECFQWSDLPLNKQGFRYTACMPSPNSTPFVPLFRTISSQPERPLVKLDWLDHSTYLRLSPSALVCTADKGFRSSRANVAVRSGSWYFEVEVLRGGGDGGSGMVVRNGERVREAGGGGDGAHVRVGWARREASLNGPCGLDGYSYGVRDLTGESVHLSRPKAYGRPFGTGDVIGCLINLPEHKSPSPADESHPGHIRRKRIPIRYKGQLYFEMLDYSTTKEMEDLVGRESKGSHPTAGTGGLPPPPGVNDVGNSATTSPGKIKTKNLGEGKEGKAVKKGRKKGPGKGGPGGDEVDTGPVVRDLPRLPGSSVRFFLNGQKMADKPAFKDLLSFLPLRQHPLPTKGRRAAPPETRENFFDDGTLGYYPCVSVFGGGKVKFNPGPEWLAPVDWKGQGVPRPMEERWDQWREEEIVIDDKEDREMLEAYEKAEKEDEEGGVINVAKRKILAPVVVGLAEGLESAESSPLPPEPVAIKPKSKAGRPKGSGTGRKKQQSLASLMHDMNRERASATPDSPNSPYPFTTVPLPLNFSSGVVADSPKVEDTSVPEPAPPPAKKPRSTKLKPRNIPAALAATMEFPEPAKKELDINLEGLSRAQIRFLQGQQAKLMADRTTLSDTPSISGGTPDVELPPTQDEEVGVNRDEDGDVTMREVKTEDAKEDSEDDDAEGEDE